ncbi:MAG TPA: 2-hydroxyacyl-CoA dehydratase family protein [Spirochaetota bacterium]|nr:2-hydroxyacyl-CoA dehydratase family protein [Spirochaetota bacterium]HNU92683.1 2-hydroxyacyl-CoA dehydratase family protein [Spirochaetota bacterium]
MNTIRQFQDVIDDSGGYARRLKQGSGGKILGYFCTYTPEEIIHAAGIHPMRLFGTRFAIAHADAHLQAYSCSLVRGVLEEALAGRLEFLDGAVFPHTCDSIQRLSDIWRLNIDFSFHADVVLPVKLDTASARKYMADVLRKFRRELEEKMGLSISDEALLKSIKTFNTIKRALEKIYRLRSENPGIISGADVYTLVKGAMIMDRSEAAEKLSAFAAALGSEKAKGPDARRRIVVSGGLCDHPVIYDLIEKSGGAVVWDDLCTGSRYFEGLVSEEGDPYEALADRYTDRVVCPAKHSSITARGDNLVRIAKEHSASGVIFLLLKFCDPHAFDYPYMKEMLDGIGVPSMLMEIEQDLPSEGQLSTRFEAFIEMLR